MGAGCRVQGAGCRVQGAGCWVLGAGCRAQGAGCRFLVEFDDLELDGLLFSKDYREPF